MHSFGQTLRKFFLKQFFYGALPVVKLNHMLHIVIAETKRGFFVDPSTKISCKLIISLEGPGPCLFRLTLFLPLFLLG